MQTVTVTDVATQIAPASPRRMALILAANGNEYTASFNPGVKSRQGMVFFANASWIQLLTEEDLGSSIKLPLYGICPSGGTSTIEVTEILEDQIQIDGGHVPPVRTPMGDFQQRKA